MSLIIPLLVIVIIALLFVVSLCYMIPQLLQTILMRQMRTHVVPKEDKQDVESDS